jgi:hypothetical protein
LASYNGIIIENLFNLQKLKSLINQIKNMKNYFLITLMLFSIFSIQAQDNNDDKQQNFNEVKLNGLYLVLGAFEGAFERILDEESGVGISLFLPIDGDVNNEINYYISPYYRMYFGKKFAAGFFVEGFGLLNSVKEDDTFSFIDDNVIVSENSVTDFALGIGIGGKWITKRGFLAELNFGIGRNLLNNSVEDFIGKAGITLGYRF